MFEELGSVVLGHDVPEHDLRKGDIGTVVYRYPEGEAFEVEFLDGGGDTVAVLTLEAGELRRMESGEILHARPLGS